MSEKNPGISFEQNAPITAAAGAKNVNRMSAISRRILLVGGTAVGASLLLGRMAAGSHG